MNNISVELATVKDKSELLKFFKHYKNEGLIKNRVECYLSHNFTVVAKTDNKIVGVVQWYLKEDPSAGVAELEEFYVLDEYRGQGIGTRIIMYAINSVKNHFNQLKIKPRKIYLFVSKSNKKAINLYRKIGFKKLAKIGNLFNDSETELLYCLSINNR